MDTRKDDELAAIEFIRKRLQNLEQLKDEERVINRKDKLSSSANIAIALIQANLASYGWAKENEPWMIRNGHATPAQIDKFIQEIQKILDAHSK